MQSIVIKPKAWNIVKTNIVWLVFMLVFIALPILRWMYPSSGWQPVGWEGIGILMIIFLGFCYMLYTLVIRALCAELRLENDKIIFRTLDRTHEMPISEMMDIDYSISANRKYSKNSREDSLYLLTSDNTVISWKIASGWNDSDVRGFVSAVRMKLTERGIKNFPFFESGLYNSSRKPGYSI